MKAFRGSLTKLNHTELADSMARVRLFGFDDKVRKKLLEHPSQKNKDSAVIGKS